jgi:hypothetical protein
MQRSSESFAALASALAKAQAQLVNPEKSLTATIRTGRAGELQAWLLTERDVKVSIGCLLEEAAPLWVLLRALVFRSTTFLTIGSLFLFPSSRLLDPHGHDRVVRAFSRFVLARAADAVSEEAECGHSDRGCRGVRIWTRGDRRIRKRRLLPLADSFLKRFWPCTS